MENTDQDCQEVIDGLAKYLFSADPLVMAFEGGKLADLSREKLLEFIATYSAWRKGVDNEAKDAAVMRSRLISDKLG